MTSCLHCGTQFSPSVEGEKFCCKGCEFVSALIADQGLGRFYDLRANTTTQPAQDRPFQKLELGWLAEQQTKAEEVSDDTPATLRLHLRGISCVGCLWLIEKLSLRRDGMLAIDIDPARGRLELKWHAGRCDLVSFAEELAQYGYAVEPWQNQQHDGSELRSLAGRLGLCGAFALNAMVFTLPRYLGMSDDFALATLFELITLISATLALLVGGSYFIARAWAALRQHVLHIDFPISLGLVTAYLGSLLGWATGTERLLYFDFVAIFAFLMLGGRYLHVAATARVRSRMQGQNPLPDSVRGNDGATIPIDELKSGMEFQVESGSLVPVCSLLRESSADISLAWMTGESEPVTVREGQRVAAGAVNLNRAPLRLHAEESATDSLIAAISRQSEKSGRSQFLERVLRIYLAAVLLTALAGAVIWLVLSRDVTTALHVALSILVISCPCALGIALPLLDRRAAASMQRLGVFVQEPSLWRRLHRTRTLLLDKTGTLTLDRPQLLNRSALDKLSTEARFALATLCAGSLHPLARSLIDQLGKVATHREESKIREVPGRGVILTQAGEIWSLGRPGWDATTGKSRNLSDERRSLACELRLGGQLVASFRFAEEARPAAKEAIATLAKRFAIRTVILSGDQGTRVDALARHLDLDPADAHGDLTPQDKSRMVRDLDAGDTLYLGDGANDSFAFDEATACGTPAADRSVLDQKADFFFTTRGLNFLPELFAVARWRNRIAALIFLFAVAYNTTAIAICLAGAMNPLLAAILMPLSSLICLALAAKGRSSSSPQFAEDPRSNREDGAPEIRAASGPVGSFPA